MTIENLVCVCLGFVIEGMTFVLGIMVGVSMKRKEANHGNSNAAVWHEVERRGTPKGTPYR